MQNWQDWGTVTIGKKAAPPKRKEEIDPSTGEPLKEETVKKFGGGANKHTAIQGSARKLEESEELKHKTVSREVRIVIQQARSAKGLKQDDLARLINEPAKVVGEYESGKAIPNNAVLGKMERVLQVKLRGKDIGTPIASSSSSSSSAKPAAKRAAGGYQGK